MFKGPIVMSFFAFLILNPNSKTPNHNGYLVGENGRLLLQNGGKSVGRIKYKTIRRMD